MNTVYNHISWFFFLLVLFFQSLFFSLFITFNKVSYYISFPIYSVWSFSLDFSLFLDFYSLWFCSVILFISSVIIVYSFFYITPYFNSIYFLWTTVIFVISILFVVIMSNLFYIILGWDGLGLVSFFLIVFYQNSSSIHSGIFTLLMNRIGDGFYLISICFIVVMSNDFFVHSSYVSSSVLLSLFLVVTFITNSAIYPFSSWLPMAMAAPTPISALVHSSTLVTSGLYLMMRYSYILYSNVNLMNILVVMCLFTSFYAGLNTMFETDLNKLIALSTLSHLGFIGFSFASGLLVFSFFHLLTHALFNSLLFITIGDIIIALNHSQDIRYLSSGYYYTPFSCFIIYTSLLNLLGIPNISGYFSNDLVLEIFSYSTFSYSLSFILYCNVFFTYFYTYQLFYYSFSSCNVVPFQLFNSTSMLHACLIFILGFFSIVFGNLFLDFVYAYSLFVTVPAELNFIPLILNGLFFIYLLLYISFPVFNSVRVSYYLSSIIFLTPFLISLSSFFYFNSSFYIVNDFELGVLNRFLHSSVSKFLSSSSNFIFGLYHVHFITLAMFLLISVLFFIF